MTTRVLFVAGLIAIVFMLAISSGDKKINNRTILAILTSPFSKTAVVQVHPSERLHRQIIMSIRLPRILLAFLVGAILALSGSILQNILENPLADPFLLGISSGAGLGAAIGILISKWFDSTTIPFFTALCAFSGALITSIWIYLLGVRDGKIQPEKLILAGVAINSLLSTLISLILLFSNKRDLIIFYLMGSLDSYFPYPLLALLYVTASTLFVFAWMLSRPMDLMTLGEDKARSMGVDTLKTKKLLFFIAAALVSIAVAFGGIIGFIGLFIPHICRFIFGFSHRTLIPMSFLLGGTFLLLCDTMARTSLPSGEIPVGILTSLAGCPFFLWFLWKKKSTIK